MTRLYERVGVLMGGPSDEREVSLRSGAAVARGLREAGYEVREIDVASESLALPGAIDAVFIALHGRFGEDGGVQRLLEDRGIPYTGSRAEASARAFNKAATKRVLQRAGIPTPAFELVREGTAPPVDLPVVVKPACQGSSIGLHIVREAAEWASAVKDALQYGGEVLAERYIAGAELTVGVVGGETLPVVEIRAPDGWYDYAAKYTPGGTQYLVPAPIPAAAAGACRELAAATSDALGCEGLGRVDLRMDEEGALFVLEMNTIPGFTETSLLPKAAASAGISFPALCGRIMESAR